MTPRDRNETTSGRWGIACAAIAFAMLGLLLAMGARESVGYDSLWHVFIARQDTWQGFWREIEDNAHPPLFYLVLRAAMVLLGKSILVYRMTSIVAAAACVPLVAWIVRRTTAQPVLGLVAGAAFASSAAVLEIGIEIRAYALSLFFLLASFAALLEAVDADGETPRIPYPHAVFAVTTTLAATTHYFTAFVLFAIVGALLTLALVDAVWRRRLFGAPHALRTAFAIVVPGIVIVLSYVLHAREWGDRLNHVLWYLHDASSESSLAFLWRTLGAFAELFAPAWLAPLPPLAVVALGLVLLAPLVRADVRRSIAALPALLVVFLVVANAAAALLGRYPFGGHLRHQIGHFPFLLVALFVAVGTGLPRAWARGRAAVVAIAIGGVAANAITWRSQVEAQTDSPWEPKVRRFVEVFDVRAAVLTDQFSLIPFFGSFHQWEWRLREQTIGAHPWQVWTVSSGPISFALCRMKDWQLDPASHTTVESLARCLEHSRQGRVAVFRVQQKLPPSRDRRETEALVRDLARHAGATLEEVRVERGDLYARFRRAASAGRARAPHPSR